MKKIGIVIYHQCPTDSIVCFGLPIYYSTIYDSIILLVTEHASSIFKLFPYAYRNIDCKIIYITSNQLIETVNNIIETDKDNFYEYLPHGIWYQTQNPNFIQNKCITENPERYLACSQYFYCNYSKYILDSEICFKYFVIDRNIDLEIEKYKSITKKISNFYYITNADISVFNNEKIPLYNYFNLEYSSDILFDMITLIENSQEIHLIGSFWSLIIYYLQLKYNLFSNIKIYFHSYVRHGRLEGFYHEHGTLSNWIFYRCPVDCIENEHSISGI